MRLGVIGDVHGNLEALEAALSALSGAGVERYACVGDVVGYGANPRECLDRVRGLTGEIVAGNHDWGVVGKISTEYFNGAARAALEWSAEVLTREEKDFLGSLPGVRVCDWGSLVHGSFWEPEAFHYVFRPAEAARSLPLQPTDLAFFGHTHIPGTFLATEPVFFSGDPELYLAPGRRALMNCGSVGQPRDGNPEASAAVLDTEKRTVTFHRVEYDLASAAGKILAAGLPPFLAQRLFLGY